MGKIKHLSQIKKLLKASPVFTAGDAERIIKNKKYAHLLLHNLFRKGEIKRIVKGCYAWEEDPILAVFCFRPGYIGLQEALSLHNLWEQETNLVIITSLKARTGLRKIFGTNASVRRIHPRYLFGIDYFKYNGLYLPISDIEKTFLDLIYFKETPSAQVIREIKKRIDDDKMNSYLKKYPKPFRQKVEKILSK